MGKLFPALKNKIPRAGLSLKFRLFGYFLIFLTLIMTGILGVLYTAGVFKFTYNESHALFERELDNISERISQDYSVITVRAIELAKKLSFNLECQLAGAKVKGEDLQSHPNLLTDLLDSQFALLTSTLERTRSSGIVVLLNATINPLLARAKHSRAGLYIKNSEPNVVNSSPANLRFLRGPMSIAQENGMQVLPQWQMEFNTNDFKCYEEMLATVSQSNLPLSRMFHWSRGHGYVPSSDPAMFCLLPLKDSKDCILGACGLEVSSMLFKLSYSPKLFTDNRVFCIFAPVEQGQMLVSGSLLAGSYRPPDLTNEPLTINETGAFCSYTQGGSTYAGLHRIINLYPADAAKQEQWSVALLVKKDELARVLTKQNKHLSGLLALLVSISIAASAFITWKFISPVRLALDTVKSEKISPDLKTGVPEIDDLITTLAARETDDLSVGASAQSPLVTQFIENIESLSAAERAVFNLYAKGCTAKEIAATLFLSINTVKTHSKRIYLKLNVSSLKELRLYIQMIEEGGAEQ